MTASVIDASNELGFKVNTYKMISLLDTSPTLPKIRDYVRFLRGKVRDLQNQEVTKPKKETQSEVKAAALLAQKGDPGGKGGKGDYKDYKGKGGGKDGGKKGKADGKKGKGAGKETASQCSHFLSDHGCKFGKTCHNMHVRLEAWESVSTVEARTTQRLCARVPRDSSQQVSRAVLASSLRSELCRTTNRVHHSSLSRHCSL